MPASQPSSAPSTTPSSYPSMTPSTDPFLDPFELFHFQTGSDNFLLTASNCAENASIVLASEIVDNAETSWTQKWRISDNGRLINACSSTTEFSIAIRNTSDLRRTQDITGCPDGSSLDVELTSSTDVNPEFALEFTSDAEVSIKYTNGCDYYLGSGDPGIELNGTCAKFG